MDHSRRWTASSLFICLRSFGTGNITSYYLVPWNRLPSADAEVGHSFALAAFGYNYEGTAVLLLPN